MVRRRLTVICAVLALAAISCSGSTAEKTAGRNTDTDGAAALTTSGSKAGKKAGAGGTGQRSSGSLTGPGGTVAGAGVPRGAVGGAKGYTGPIRVAFVLQDTSGASAYVGGDFGGAVDTQKKESQALVDWANAHGGMNGRKIVPSYYTVDLTASDDDSLATCTQITEDDHNQVVIDANGFHLEKDSACFAKHGVNLIAQVNGTDHRFLQSVSPFISTTSTTIDRQMREMVTALKAAGYFTSARVGIFADDFPAMHRNINDVLLPALAAVGVKPLDTRYASVWDGSAQQQSQAQAQNQNAVLSFKGKNVNRVITFNYGLNFLGFSKGAKSQNYAPRYAFPEYLNAPGVAVSFADADQLKDAVAVSSSPTHVEDDADTTTPVDKSKVSPGERRCNDIMSQQLKTDYYSANSGASGFQGFFCDHFLLWLDAARKLGDAWTPLRLGVGLKTLGTSYPSPMVHSTDFSEGRMDGASSYRAGKFNSTCTCFVQTSVWLRAPE